MVSGWSHAEPHKPRPAARSRRFPAGHRGGRSRSAEPPDRSKARRVSSTGVAVRMARWRLHADRRVLRFTCRLPVRIPRQTRIAVLPGRNRTVASHRRQRHLPGEPRKPPNVESAPRLAQPARRHDVVRFFVAPGEYGTAPRRRSWPKRARSRAVTQDHRVPSRDEPSQMKRHPARRPSGPDRWR